MVNWIEMMLSIEFWIFAIGLKTPREFSDGWPQQDSKLSSFKSLAAEPHEKGLRERVIEKLKLDFEVQTEWKISVVS